MNLWYTFATRMEFLNYHLQHGEIDDNDQPSHYRKDLLIRQGLLEWSDGKTTITAKGLRHLLFWNRFYQLLKWLRSWVF